MKILALDTATENCSVALLIDGRLSTREERLPRGHAERLLPMVDELLRQSGTALRGLDAIAYGRGPGAFTGVRLAASVTQGLAFGAGLPVVPVSDLRAVAQRAFDTAPGAHVLVCSDARMQEVYWACFERAADGLAAPAGAERVSPPAQVALPAGWPDGTPGAGSGFAAYPELVRALAGRVRPWSETLLPRAAEIARLAQPEVVAGRVLPADQAVPVYLRDEVARPPAALVIKLTPG
ncbi:MAG TPA: tRNA (adenosine(37)-N6)-threonylcarbamoyltransferase complex dimerization subunit type 1 TsaB [Steroidobacteraceae bacterium]|nr:tRNA (adenosine(37)-N6)-threonylcarbamoyltransferase complex dimerization subunit type 1 TsaB [Steroidobacteraceae bacterium]